MDLNLGTWASNSKSCWPQEAGTPQSRETQVFEIYHHISWLIRSSLVSPTCILMQQKHSWVQQCNDSLADALWPGVSACMTMPRRRQDRAGLISAVTPSISNRATYSRLMRKHKIGHRMYTTKCLFLLCVLRNTPPSHPCYNEIPSRSSLSIHSSD